MTTSHPTNRQPQTENEYALYEYLSHLYGGGVAPELTQSLLSLVERKNLPDTKLNNRWQYHAQQNNAWSEAEVLLITYGDTITAPDLPPLQVLKRFADTHLAPYFSGIHILPFFPFSSDDGFAVVDYSRVRDDLGDWEDIRALSEHFDLMFDLVINHCSREHIWFADFISGRAPGCDFFMAMPVDTDVSQVIRPRNTPLLSQVETYTGPRHVWTTFSDDQVDLNFENPEVLCRFVEILFDYVAQGANLIRLDAIAFLWKRLGTSCMSLPETHMVVKILRLLLDHKQTNVRLLTETNVPHDENVSYFGQQDEAHMVYQFSLAPLLVYSYLFNNGSYLQSWAMALDSPPAGCTYLNFIASHDGIGLRPLEGLVPDHDIDALIDVVHERGGYVSMRSDSNGAQKAYEMNIALVSAFGGNPEAIPAYVSAHQLLLAFQGVPALYLRAFLGTPNDLQEVERTGRTRSINRGHLDAATLRAELADPEQLQARIYQALSRSLEIRRSQPAFSPSATQEVLPCQPQLFAMCRRHAQQQILVLTSFLPVEQHVSLQDLIDLHSSATLQDLLTGTLHKPETTLFLAPYQTLWLELAGN
jgi:sucrose phosphorylase